MPEIHCGDVVHYDGKKCEVLSYKPLDFGDYVVSLKLPDGKVKKDVLIAN